jgi:hypothetical protein
MKWSKKTVTLNKGIKNLRQKTWFSVYEENLKLQEELKVAKAVIESVETFIGRFTNEK